MKLPASVFQPWGDHQARAEIPGPVLVGNAVRGAGFILPWHIFQPTYRCVQWGNGSSLPDGRIDNRREPRDGEGRIRKTGNVSSFWTERGSSYMTGKRPVINCGKR